MHKQPANGELERGTRGLKSDSHALERNVVRINDLQSGRVREGDGVKYECKRGF